MYAIDRIPHNRIRFSPEYRYAVSLIMRRYAGTNRCRRALKAFRVAYIRCSNCIDRDEYAAQFVSQKEMEVSR